MAQFVVNCLTADESAGERVIVDAADADGAIAATLAHFEVDTEADLEENIGVHIAGVHQI